jgi:hypothetical protein
MCEVTAFVSEVPFEGMLALEMLKVLAENGGERSEECVESGVQVSKSRY